MPPSSARKISDVAATNGAVIEAGVASIVKSGMDAPIAKVAADASAA
jgi:hypothetical protein